MLIAFKSAIISQARVQVCISLRRLSQLNEGLDRCLREVSLALTHSLASHFTMSFFLSQLVEEIISCRPGQLSPRSLFSYLSCEGQGAPLPLAYFLTPWLSHPRSISRRAFFICCARSFWREKEAFMLFTHRRRDDARPAKERSA